ncbi:MAG: hypothetical protein IMF19_14955, partial [Proteobacteria bacterium]|nr:hypothetical protein [Pseudomonadota bacterium]
MVFRNTKALPKKHSSYNIMVSKFSDVAVGLSEDRLGFRDYADGVIATLESLSKEDTPFTIGIFGSWGSGKTSFMQIMRELLQVRGYETIFFKSWEYGNEEKPWIPFMIKVVDELFKDVIDKPELIKNIFLFSTDVVLQTYSQGKISAGGILNVYKGSRKTSPFKDWSGKDANIVIERVTKIEKFKNKIKKRAEDSPRGKIIIFIDDLDRMPEEKIVDFLDSLKIFLDIRGCIFVLGCDYEILKNALRKKHEEEEIYKDYFDKIVQTDFYIPKISEQAIKNYLQFLTGWSEDDIKECTQLVNNSIGGNPRKIKRVVNATMLIKSVFEKKLATFLQAFERPKPMVSLVGQGIEGKEGAPEEPMALKWKITKIFTLSEVFDHLFEKKMLFKLMCMREQWPAYYEDILSEEKKQKDLISLQWGYIPIDIREYTELISTAKVQKELEENVKKLSDFLKDPPGFQGADRFQEVMSLKTYLTLLKISSPEAGIALKWEEPVNLPINLFNRYMFFERINKGKVDETIIEKKIEQRDWESDLSSYTFFIKVISLFGYDNLLRDLFRKNRRQITREIRSSTDLWAIGRLLGSVRKVDEGTTRKIFNRTKKTYAKKIIASSDLFSIGLLLYYVRKIGEATARDLLSETKDTIAEKIIASSDPGAIGWLFHCVRGVEEKTARGLLSETKDTIAEKIIASSDPRAIGWLLHCVRGVEEKTARDLLSETKDTIAEKIIASSDPRAIGWLFRCVRGVEEKTARDLLNGTKNTYAKKIKYSTDPKAIARLLYYVRKIDEATARDLLNETWNTYAKKIKYSTDPYSIERLLFAVRKIEKETAQKLLH